MKILYRILFLLVAFFIVTSIDFESIPLLASCLIIITYLTFGIIQLILIINEFIKINEHGK